MNKCIYGRDHKFTNEYSEYCENGCGEKESVFTIKSLINKTEKLEYELSGFKTMYEELKKENQILRDALNFYANNSTGVWTCDGEHELEMNSERAREALEKVGK